MLSPVGSSAATRVLPCETVTCGWGGNPGVAARAEGLLGLSTMVIDAIAEAVEVVQGVLGSLQARQCVYSQCRVASAGTGGVRWEISQWGRTRTLGKHKFG